MKECDAPDGQCQHVHMDVQGRPKTSSPSRVQDHVPGSAAVSWVLGCPQRLLYCCCRLWSVPVVAVGRIGWRARRKVRAHVLIGVPACPGCPPRACSAHTVVNTKRRPVSNEVNESGKRMVPPKYGRGRRSWVMKKCCRGARR